MKVGELIELLRQHPADMPVKAPPLWPEKSVAEQMLPVTDHGVYPHYQQVWEDETPRQFLSLCIEGQIPTGDKS